MEKFTLFIKSKQAHNSENSFVFCFYRYVCVCVDSGKEDMWQSEDNLKKSVLSFSHEDRP